MLEVSPTLASIVVLALFISCGLVLFLALTVRSLKRENLELDAEVRRAAEDYALLRDCTPFPKRAS